jgi:tetratricopeptide (TPR) repeat protein
MLLLFWWKRESWGRPFLFALGYFTITLFPFLGFLNIYYMRYSLVADHYQYQSIIGIIALVVGVGYYGFSKLREDLKPKAIVLVGIVMVLLCFQTWRQAHVYQNVESLFDDTIAKNPSSWMANYNQGHFLQEQGRDAEAMEYYTKAFILDPENPSPLNNMGNLVLKEGKIDQAISYFMTAVRVKPDFGESYYNMGVAFQESGRLTEAITQYYNAIRVAPGNERAHNNLANALATQGRLSQSIPHYNQALRANPNFIDAHVNKGIILKKMGRYDEALKHFYAALRIDPGNSRARYNISAILNIKAGAKEAK